MDGPPRRSRSGALRPVWVRLIKEVDPSQPEPVVVRGPQDAVNLLRERAARELVEVFSRLRILSGCVQSARMV
jgi:hypothetical protein